MFYVDRIQGIKRTLQSENIIFIRQKSICQNSPIHQNGSFKRTNETIHIMPAGTP
jgi:hypothetical protein